MKKYIGILFVSVNLAQTPWQAAFITSGLLLMFDAIEYAITNRDKH